MTLKDYFESKVKNYRLPVALFIVAVAYYGSAKFGLLLSFKPDYIAALWPPNAILLCALLVTTPRFWPWYLLVIIPAEFAADLPAGIPVDMALGFVIADWVEVLVAATLLRKFSASPLEFKSLKQTSTYIACCVLAAPFAAAFPGALVTGGWTVGPEYMTRFLRWFLSDALTHLLITPFIVLWLCRKYARILFRPLPCFLEISGLMLILAIVCIATFSGKLFDIRTFPAIIYAPLPILLWISVRFGPRQIFSSTLLVAVICIWYGSRGDGLFIDHSAAQNVFNLQIFLAVISIPLLLLTALLGDHKASEKKLRESEQKYRDLTESLSDWVWEVDSQGVYTYSSPKVQELLGYAPEEVIGKKPFDFMSREDAVRVSKAFAAAVSTKTSFDCWENINITRSGDSVIMESSGVPYFDSAGALMGYRGIDRDITQRKKDEQAIADSERRLTDIIEFLPDPTWVIDTKGLVIAWNRAMENLSGITKEEIIGKGDYAYAVPFYGRPRPVLIDLILKRDDEFEKGYLNIEENEGVLVKSESFHPGMGDGGCYFSATAARLFNIQGDVIGAIESLRDITDAKRSEQEREHLIAELKEAIAKVNTLSGMLPICSSCKNIRDDNGYWNQIEAYISEHSLAEFTHSICPKCVKKLYPELDIKND